MILQIRITWVVTPNKRHFLNGISKQNHSRNIRFNCNLTGVGVNWNAKFWLDSDSCLVETSSTSIFDSQFHCVEIFVVAIQQNCFGFVFSSITIWNQNFPQIQLVKMLMVFNILSMLKNRHNEKKMDQWKTCKNLSYRNSMKIKLLNSDVGMNCCINKCFSLKFNLVNRLLYSIIYLARWWWFQLCNGIPSKQLWQQVHLLSFPCVYIDSGRLLFLKQVEVHHNHQTNH